MINVFIILITKNALNHKSVKLFGRPPNVPSASEAVSPLQTQLQRLVLGLAHLRVTPLL